MPRRAPSSSNPRVFGRSPELRGEGEREQDRSLSDQSEVFQAEWPASSRPCGWVAGEDTSDLKFSGQWKIVPVRSRAERVTPARAMQLPLGREFSDE